ncbi:predicted protein [Naegleria gruberi]|uniref:Predicted protein n=1 Tax=Naegleria gruberi TaxID=5762 RepID=D2VKK0_NAEGR|nr:uncharacterized protein NAEGRDRAFT_69420 [Naegleria gruberi]EFC42610.1 predicted protein [Naegleria gruberi]|eukprot:XP_002675354.1 predicted protein [Naegleria gruberi strain NEG-M]
MSRKQGIEPKFIVDDRGHIIDKEKHAKPGTSFPQTTGQPLAQSSFSFTPVGYQGYGVRPNHVILGTRPQVGETNPQAHHFLHKHENNKTFGYSTAKLNSLK